MAKISYMLGFTLNLNPDRNEYLRTTVEISEIDTELDVVEQLKKCHEGLWQVMQWADEQVVAKVEAATGKKWVAG